MKYSLAVPFLQRIFQLAIAGGYTGQITANSFMKREFGKKLIEEFFPKVDLTHVIDTSGAYIPGHGTPTVILFARNRNPVANTIRTVMGIRGEPSTPEDPFRGLVWSAIVGQIDEPGSQSEYVSVADSPRELFHKHPWSIGGGGAAELKEQLEQACAAQLLSLADVGVGAVTLEDEAYQLPATSAKRAKIPRRFFRDFVIGDSVRDWRLHDVDPAIFPHVGTSCEPVEVAEIMKRLWPLKAGLSNRLWFRKTQLDRGIPWFAYGHISAEKFRTRLSIVFAFVATHNHFVLDRGGKVFNRSAPVIKLPPSATENDHLALLGLLNSSTACFWMKQVFFPKGGDHVGQEGARIRRTWWDERFEFAGTGLEPLPLPRQGSLDPARQLDSLVQRLTTVSPVTILTMLDVDVSSLYREITTSKADWEQVHRQMIALQEELDWQCYRLYGLLEDDLTYAGDPPPIQLGQRAFEIVLARKMAAGEVETTWFERHSAMPITEIPPEWPEEYRRLVCRRIEKIETDRNIALIEQPEYKRRWNTETWDSQLERALRNWLLDRLESYFDFDGRMNEEGKPTAQLDQGLISVARLADVARQDTEFLQVAELFRDDQGFDVQKLVTELIEAESVPLLPILRYKPSGLRKRAEWERTWALQRQEDLIDARIKLPKDHQDFLTEDQARDQKRQEVGDIPVPPKYTSADFLTSDYWRLRGKLDVPKERWVSFPYCEGNDGMLVIAWAGYDHLQLARAISAYYVDVQERLGGRDDPRLVPLLACLIELLPWLKQWHNEVDREFGMPMGDHFEGFIQEEARQMGTTLAEIQAWEPPRRVPARKRRG